MAQGMTQAAAKRRRLLSAEVQNSVEARALVEYHIAIAAGECNVRLSRNGQGIITDGQKGIPPTQAERTASINWLSDRGHGLPVQAHVLHAQITSTTGDDTPTAGALPAPIFWALRDALQAVAARTVGPASAGELPPGAPSGAASGIDPCTVIDVPAAPELEPRADADPPAGPALVS